MTRLAGFPIPHLHSIQLVAQERVPHVLAVHSDLVCPARVRLAGEQRGAPQLCAMR